jgi:hypothetical protein
MTTLTEKIGIQLRKLYQNGRRFVQTVHDQRLFIHGPLISKLKPGVYIAISIIRSLAVTRFQSIISGTRRTQPIFADLSNSI